MLKKLAPALLTLALLAGPLFAAATTTDDLIQDLLRQIQQLQQQLRILQGQGGNNVPQSCVVLNYNLYLGLTDQDTSGEVTKLQQFLASDRSIYPEGKVTGYFGPATERAVKRYQSRNGIVSGGSPETTGYGVVGPKTREYMARGCTSTQQLSLSVIGVPMNPLQVNQVGTWTLDAYPNNGNLTYSASWGDGRSTVGQTSPTFSHAYTLAGTFTPSFTVLSGTGRTASANAPTVTVVGTSTAAPTCTLSASPSTVTAGQSSTLTWSSTNASYALFEGNAVNTSGEKVVTPTQTTTYTITFVGGSAGNGMAQSVTCQTTVTVTPNNTGISFSASPTSGTAPLTVGFTGVATRPNFAADGQSSINFGDGTSRNITNFADPPAGNSVPALGSFAETHTYTSAGTFTATMTSAGGGTRTATVTVSAPAALPSCSITASPATITQGQSATITWSSTNAAGGTISSIGSVDPSGSRVVTPSQTTVYSGLFTGSGPQGMAAATCSATVTVTPVALGKCTYRGQQYVEGSQISVATFGGQWPGGEATLKCDNGVWLAGGVSNVPEFGINACDWWIGGITFSDATRSELLCGAKKYSTRGFYVHDMAVTPRHGAKPLTVSLYDLSRCADVAIGPRCLPYSVAWGDGTTSDYPSSGNMDDWAIPATHTYSTAGSYTLTLTVDHAPWAYPAQTDIHTDTANIRVDAQ